MTAAAANAKINLALIVGPLREDGKHEVVTVLQRLDLADEVAIERSDRLSVDGFADDTLVRDALTALAAAAGCEPAWRVRLTKRIPVAAGLGGGSSNAATALCLANDTLAAPLGGGELHELAARLGSDVPFFLRTGPQLGTGDGSELEPLELPRDYAVLLVLPSGTSKESTAAVYREFDRRDGARGFAERQAQLLTALAVVERAVDLARLPKNDLARSPLAVSLEQLGAFRADVSGAGPVVYGLFRNWREATAAARASSAVGQTIVAAPAW